MDPTEPAPELPELNVYESGPGRTCFLLDALGQEMERFHYRDGVMTYRTVMSHFVEPDGSLVMRQWSFHPDGTLYLKAEGRKNSRGHLTTQIHYSHDGSGAVVDKQISSYEYHDDGTDPEASSYDMTYTRWNEAGEIIEHWKTHSQ